MGQIARWVPAYSAGGLTRPALALDENGNIILFGEAADFVAMNGLKLLYLGLPASTPFPPITLAPGTTQTATPSDATPPVVIPPNPPATQTASAASGGSDRTAPAFTLNGITRPELHFDGAGNIVLDPAAAQFVAAYGVKPLYAGLPASTPAPPVAATPPSTPTDSNAATNSIVEGASANSATGVTASSTSLTGQTITYALTADSSSGGFKIDAATGVVTVADPGKINFETAANGAYQISVSASDGIFTVSQTFTISVTNVAPSTPIDSNAATNTVAEGAAVGTIVGITALSSDINGPAVTYSLTADSSNGGFTINAATGVVTVADSNKLDYETSGAGKTYNVTVAASDGSQTALQTFSISVSDVPLTTSTDANTSANLVAEGAAVGSTVGLTAFATDPNGPTTTYSLTADSSGGGFTIDPATGVVTVADSSKIDFESAPGNAYSITVQANNGAMTTSQSFSIAVGNVAPLTPVDGDAAANTVLEGAANGSAVGVTASSTDINGPAVTYSLVSDTSGGGFTIDATTGIVTIADATRIDFESSGGSYTVTAQASDGTLTSSQTFTIAVTDVAPSTPVDANAAANTIAEGAANGSTVGITASSTDINGPAVTYSLIGDTSGGGFTIDSATGVVTVADTSKIDFESSGGSYSITTQASDGTLSSSQTFTIAVSNAAPTTPVDGDAATNTIAEDAANGSTVGVTVSSTDVNGPATTYTLVGDTSGGGFAIDATTGVVTVADATRIDFESSGGSYTIVAQASDGTLTSSQAFTIAVTDVAPSTPVDANAAANAIAEGAANGSTVGITASSTDVNGPAVSYSLTDSAGGRFTIDPVTGVVTVANGAAIDFETAPGNVYSITAQASDGTLTSSQTFTIAVTDVAPSTPVDANAAANAIAEGAANGSTVGITASSTDINGPAVTYSLIGDTSGGGFTIDAATGVVTVADAIRIDFESSGGSYSITTQASDGTLTSSQTFTIAVTDVAPSTPVDGDAATNTIAEGAANGSTVGVTVSSTDVNGPTTTYTLVGDTSGGGFAIDATTGVVTVADATRIDFESSGGSYTIVAQASDGTLTSSQAFTIAVTNSPPSVPTDASASANKTFAGAATGSVTGVTASSNDPGGGTVTYALLDDNGAVANGGDRFQIDASTGVVTISGVNPIIYDSVTPANNDYVITVRASDPSGAFASQTFTITVDPNQPPVIGTNGGGDNAAISIAENGTAVTTVNATDGDNGPSPISYSIVGGDDANKFGIVASGAGAGTLTFITPPDFENSTDTATNGSNTYTVVVRASDGAAFDDQTITVTVTDTNDAPVITSNGGGGGGTASININENQTAVTTVMAADQDSPAQTLTYSIVNGGGSPDSAKFAIDASGHLTFIGAPNFEIPGSAANSNAYTVQVQVSDNGAGDLTDIQTITVNVQNINEAPTTNAVTANGAEDAASIAITLSGTDPDAGDSIASYTITNLPSPSQGVLYSDIGLTNAVVSGQTYGATLYLDPAPNFNGAVTFSATANDASGLAGNTATETINITPVNDAPTNNGVPASFVVQSGFSHSVTGLSITDIDANASGTPTDITTTLSAASGTINVGAVGGGAVVSGNGSGSVTLTGSIAQINASLGGSVAYTAPDTGSASSSTTSITITTNDAGHTGADPGATGNATSEADVDTIQVGVTPQVWFINSDQSALDNNAPRGSQTNPFSTISEFNASSGPGNNDYIYLKAGTYTGDGINLKDGQTLLGDDQALSFADPFGGPTPIVIETASGARPTINVTTNGDQGIDLASGNTVRGVNITTGAGTTGLDDGSGATGGSVGALTVSSVAISGAGGAVDIDQGGALNVTLESASSSGGAYGIQLGGSISGTFTGGTGTLSGHTTSEFDVSGGSGTVSYNGTIGNGSGLSASIASRTGGSVTLSGNINDSNDAGGGITVSSNTGGTITFSGTTKTLNTGASNGVDLSGNTGATINFTNGGLDIDTTSGIGFDATGAGTFTVQGTGNSINATSGTALNVNSTTIGSNDLTFQSISSGNGANNGIVLDTTGSLGGLHVTGTGTTVGSGGTIQGKTGADGSTTGGIGIYLNNTTDVQLNGMNLQNFDNLGLYGTGVNGFQFTNSAVGGTIGTSTGSNDAAIGFGTTGDGGANGLTGTSLIDNVNVSGAIEHNIEIYQHSGQANLTIRNSNIHDNNTSTGSDGLLVETFGTADLRLKVSGTTFDDNRSQAFQLNALRQSTVNLTVDNNTVLRTNQGNEGFIFQNSNDADLTLAITNNVMTGIVGTNIFVGQVAGQGTALSELNATISGNTIDQTGGVNRTVVAFLSSVSGSTAQSQSKLLINNNNITSDIGSQQIFVSTPDANTAPNYHATVTNNTVIVTNASAANGAITVQATQGVAGQGATATTEISGNDVQRPNGVGAGISDIVLRTASPGGGASNPSIRLDPGISGSSDVATVLAQNNPLSTTLALISPAGSITVVNNVVLLPSSPISPPLPLLAVQGGIAADTPTSGETNLSQAQLNTVVAAALNHWQSAGLTAAQLATLQSIVYSVSDLSGTRLGDHAAGHIFLDNDAAGHGWFVDPTPGDSSEFGTQLGGSATHLAATASQGPAGHYDLLTAVMHEMGHAIGLDDRAAASDSDNLMYGYLQTGERRLPASIDVVLAAESALPSSARAVAGTPIVIGTAQNDIILAGQIDQTHGSKILFGGLGTDTFVFDTDVQPGTSTQITHVADYSAAQGDRFDFTGLAAVIQQRDVGDLMQARAVADPGGHFATLQINSNAAPEGSTAWVSIAQLDGIHAGDFVDVVIGPAIAPHLLHLHVDLIA